MIHNIQSKMFLYDPIRSKGSQSSLNDASVTNCEGTKLTVQIEYITGSFFFSTANLISPDDGHLDM